MQPGSLLLVDDDRSILEAIAEYLRSLGYRTETASSCREAKRRIVEHPFDAIVADLNLRDADGFELLAYCRQERPETPVIFITGYGTIESAVEAIRAGAFDYLTKPLLEDELRLSLERALGQRRLVEENKNLKAQLDLRFGLGNIVGHDYKMLKLFDLIESVADSRTTVLILGESGTGKTMTARAIHRLSARRDKPFVEVACGALPESLLESELFGHKAGSFTGAIADRPGKFLQADGGTIFLDEIGTASASLQVKLLRVLQEREFEPVGSTETRKVDVRVILATNQNLEERVAKGEFRQDLYYRINVVMLELSPLRERIGDIPLLAGHFLRKFGEQSGKRIRDFSDDAMEALQGYPWPGNVRELENVVERAVVLTKREVITADDLPPNVARREARLLQEAGLLRADLPLKNALEQPERQILLRALESHGWNRQKTADALGINRTTLYKKMKRYKIELETSYPG